MEQTEAMTVIEALLPIEAGLAVRSYGMADRTAQRLARVTKIALGLPEATSRAPGRHTQFLVRKKTVAYFLVDHHDNGRVELQVRAAPGENAALVEADPECYHLPKYMAHHGWVGVWFDLPTVDWDEVESLIVASYRLQAPKTLVKQLDA